VTRTDVRDPIGVVTVTVASGATPVAPPPGNTDRCAASCASALRTAAAWAARCAAACASANWAFLAATTAGLGPPVVDTATAVAAPAATSTTAPAIAHQLFHHGR
jgi:hypothetical protein